MCLLLVLLYLGLSLVLEFVDLVDETGCVAGCLCFKVLL